MSELVSTRIHATAAKLGLPHLAEALTQYTQRADEAKMGYLDFLDLVLSEELAVRDDRRFRTGLRISKLLLRHRRGHDLHATGQDRATRPGRCGEGPVR
ncbi:ATP-binding protein [Spongiactinospora sp. 9N601]|uniref:ATP-binding protein n=1 Tax=Spongiactinospora sp. 9N601 TaxID=3375149 RepID=UPI0037B11E25